MLGRAKSVEIANVNAYTNIKISISAHVVFMAPSDIPFNCTVKNIQLTSFDLRLT